MRIDQGICKVLAHLAGNEHFVHNTDDYYCCWWNKANILLDATLLPLFYVTNHSTYLWPQFLWVRNWKWFIWTASLGISHEILQSRFPLGLNSFEGLTGAEGCPSKVAHSQAWKVRAVVGKRPQFFTTWLSSYGCLSILTTWCPVSPKMCDPREHYAALSFMTSSWNLPSSFSQCPTGYTHVTPT